MYGWWFMPVFAILFIVVILFFVGRFFSSGGFCGRTPMNRSMEDKNVEEMRKEIQELRDEIRGLEKGK